MKKIFFIILALNMCSCNYFYKDYIDVTITNNTDSPIKDIKISTKYDSIILKEIKPHKSFNGKFLFINNDKEIHDNFYRIDVHFKRLDKAEDRYFCSDINLKRFKRVLILDIENDTIKSEFNGECY